MDIKCKPNVFYRCSELFVALGRFIKQRVIKIYRKLFDVLRKAVKQSANGDVLQITLNYRDSSYHREQGGYDSVVLSQPKGEFRIYGDSYAEMARELDFDFSSATPFVPCSQPSLIIDRIKAILKMWLYDFLNYLKYGVSYPIKLIAW